MARWISSTSFIVSVPFSSGAARAAAPQLFHSKQVFRGCKAQKGDDSRFAHKPSQSANSSPNIGAEVSVFTLRATRPYWRRFRTPRRALKFPHRGDRLHHPRLPCRRHCKHKHPVVRDAIQKRRLHAQTVARFHQHCITTQLPPVVVPHLPRRQLEIDNGALAFALQQQVQLATHTHALVRQPNPKTAVSALPPILSQPAAHLQPFNQVLRVQRLAHLPCRLPRPWQNPMIVDHPRAVSPLLQLRHRDLAHASSDPSTRRRGTAALPSAAPSAAFNSSASRRY